MTDTFVKEEAVGERQTFRAGSRIGVCGLQCLLLNRTFREEKGKCFIAISAF